MMTMIRGIYKELVLNIVFGLVLVFSTTVIPPIEEPTWGNWSSWSPCDSDLYPSSECYGKTVRVRLCLGASGWVLDDHNCTGDPTQTATCNISIHGGWSVWSGFGPCSVTCGQGVKKRSRDCNDPEPCHAGNKCSGNDTEYINCTEGTVDGGFSDWGNWSTCSVSMGTGIATRYRQCDSPPVCFGDPCIGPTFEVRDCEVIPKCFSRHVLDPEYSSESTPMQAYINSKVDIFSTLVVHCPSNPWYYWTLEKDNTILEITAGNPFLFRPTELGLYQLNLTAFEGGHSSEHYLHDVMYINTVYPPPNAFISGGSGTMIGEGIYTIDALTESYDLTKGRGYNEDLEFEWMCTPLTVTTLYETLKSDIDPEYLFPSNNFDWLNRSFFGDLSRANMWAMNDSYMMQYINQVPDSIEFCNKTDSLETDFMALHSKMISNASFISSVYSLRNTIQRKLSKYQNAIMTLSVSSSPDPVLINKTTVWVAEVAKLNTQFVSLYSSLYWLNKKIPYNMTEMCNTSYVDTFITTADVISSSLEGIVLTDIVSIAIEEFAINELVQNTYVSWSCSNFTAASPGIAEIMVTRDDVINERGFIFTVKVSVNDSASYFQQRAATTQGNPPLMKIGCRLNCMQKMSVSSVLSLYADCPLCSFNQVLAMKYKWKILNFDTNTKETTELSGWQNMMLSEPETASFVLKAFSLQKSTDYIIEINTTSSLNGYSSVSFMIVTTNIPPYGGECRAKYVNGIAGVTPCDLSCKRWNDEGFRSEPDPALDWKETLSYRVYARDRDGNMTLLYYGTEKYETVFIPEGDPTNDYKTDIVFHVYDIFQDYTEYVITTKSNPAITSIDTHSINSFLEASEVQIEISVKSGNFKMVSMSVENAAGVVTNLDLPKSAVPADPSQWSSIGSVSNGGRSTNWTKLWNDLMNPPLEETKQNITDSTGSYSETVRNVVLQSTNEADMLNVNHYAHSMGTVLGNKDLVSTTMVENAVRSNDFMLNLFIAVTNRTSFPVFEDFQATSEAILRLTDNALHGLLPTLSPEFPDEVEIYSMQSSLDLKAELSSDSNESSITSMERAYFATQMAQQHLQRVNETTNEVKNFVPQILDSVETLGKVLSKMAHLKQLPVFVNRPGIRSSMEKKTLPELINGGIMRENISMAFLKPSNPDTDSNDVQITLFDETPFNWDPESKYITTPTVSMNIRNSTGDKRTLPVTVTFPNNIQGNTKTVFMAIPSDKTQPSSQVVFYKLLWQNHGDDIVFRMEGDTSQLKCTVYLRVGKAPSRHDYDLVSQSVQDSGGFLATFSPGICQSSCLLYFAALLETDISSGSSRRKRSVSYNNTTNSTQVQHYQVVAWTVGCRVWDTALGEWDKTSCTLSSSTASGTTCVCDNPPGTYFATTFYVPPNTIDFSSVFDKFDIINNGAVFGTVIGLLCLYALLCVWAVIQDRADKKRWSLIYLVDNKETDDYLYIVTVYTGLDSNAGTTSRVSIAVTSNKRDTGVRRLRGQKHGDFGVGSVRRFVMSVRKKLGDLKYVNVWHDNSGKGSAASWYLAKIVIEDIQTSQRFTFVCNQWLSVDSEDGMIQRVLVVEDDSDMDTFGHHFRENTRKTLPDNHIWLSVFIRPEDNNFNRVQRLSCCLTFLFLAMITNAMFYRTDSKSQQIVLGPLKFSLSSIYTSLVSVIICAVPLIIISFIFRKSKKRSSKPNHEKNKSLVDIAEIDNETGQQNKKNNAFLLPFWCIFVAWTLIVLAVVLSGFFVILYSMEWGKAKSEEWLLCFFITFFESVFIADPVKIIVISMIFAYFFRKKMAYNCGDICREELLKESKTHASDRSVEFVDGPTIPQPPLSSDIVEKLKEIRQKEIKAQRVFLELVYYIFFVMVLYLLSFSNRDNRSFWLHQHLSQHLLHSTKSNTSMDSIRFHKIVTTADFYKWNQKTLLPFLFPVKSYNGNYLVARERLYVDDQANFRVGPLRFRQLRSNSDQCTVPLMAYQTCYKEYSMPRETTTDYCIGWTDVPCDPKTVTNPSYSAWKFTSSVDVWGSPSFGEYSLYGGGGYIAEMGVNFDVSNYTVDELQKNLWIDRQTRAVFVEFTLYSVGMNLFAYASLLVEFPDTGGVITSDFVRVFRTYQHLGNIGTLVFIAEIIFLICMVIFIVKLLQVLFKQKCKFFKDLWHILDFAVVILTIVGLSMYLARLIFTEKTMSNFTKNKNLFVNFGHIAFWDEILGAFIGSIVFLVTIRLMRVLSYNHRMTRLASVLSHCSKDLIGCMIVFLIVYTAYVLLGYLIFGRNLNIYRNVFVAMTTITNALIGRNSIDGLIDTSPIIAQIYYFTFVLFVMWILMTMLNATLNQSISTIRKQSDEFQIPYGIHDMAVKMFQQFLLVLRLGLQKSHITRKNPKREETLVIEDYEA